MTIATPTLTGDGNHPIEVNAPFAVNFKSDAFVAGSLAAELKAAPTRDGSAIYLTHVTMSIVKNVNRVQDTALTLVGGDGAALFGPIQLQENGKGIFSKDFRHPLKVSDKKALDLSGAGPGGGYQTAAFVYVEGFIGDSPIG